MQHDDRAVGWVEVPKRLVEHPAIGYFRRDVGGRREVDLLDLDLDRAPLTASSDIEAGIDGQSMEPCIEPVGVTQTTQIAPCSDESLLDRVTREFRVPEDESGSRVQPRNGQVDDRGKGVMIAIPRSLDETSLIHDRLGYGTATVVAHIGYGVPPPGTVQRSSRERAGICIRMLRQMSDDATRDALAERLEALGVPYELFPCDPALADTAAFCEAYGFDPDQSANTILVIGKSDPPRYAACVVLATTRLDVNRAVRDKLGTRKASFAPAEVTREITGHEIGGVTVFGLPNGMPIWVDARVMQRDRIVLGGGSRNWKVIGPPAILERLPGVEVVEDLAKVPEPAA